MRASSAGTAALAASSRFSAAAMTGAASGFSLRFLEIGFRLLDFGLCLRDQVVRYEGRPSGKYASTGSDTGSIFRSVLPKSCGTAGWSGR